MKYCPLKIFLFLLAVIGCNYDYGEANASPLSVNQTALLFEKSALMRTGYDYDDGYGYGYSNGYHHGCGWDYPCTPQPYFRRRNHRYGNRIIIHNNYGTINIYSNGYLRRRYYYRHRYRPCYERWCGHWWRSGRHYPALENKAATWRPYRDGGCGIRCWYGRFKRGYCGHGCDYYLQSRAEVEYRRFEEPREAYYDEMRGPRRDHEYERRPEKRVERREEKREESGDKDEIKPLGPYPRPKYP